jgi:hypothetical protein
MSETGLKCIRRRTGLDPELKSLPSNTYFDNLFTSLPLLKELKDRGYSATGTIRVNRIPNDIPLKSVAQMKKEPRGGMSSTTDSVNKITVVRWVDNAVVSAASTLCGTNPLHPVSRWSAKEKKRVSVSQPKLLDFYNRGMQGTDRMDQNVACYRIGVRIRKWWWPIFAWMIGITVQNAWLVFREKTPCPQLQFIRTVLQVYLKQAQQRPSAGLRRAVARGRNAQLLDDIRFDGMDHFVVPTEKQGTCSNCPSLSERAMKTFIWEAQLQDSSTSSIRPKTSPLRCWRQPIGDHVLASDDA